MRISDILKIKRTVRLRDGMSCTDCGMTNDDHVAQYGRSLEVHRVTPGSLYSADPGVCVTLCRRCHHTKPKRPRGSVDHANLAVRVPLPIWDAICDIAADRFMPPQAILIEALTEYLTRLGRMPPPPPKAK